MNKKEFENLVGSKWFTVCFVKADGSERIMHGRRKVSKYVKGGRPISDKVIGVWDREKLRENLKAGMRRWDAGHKAYRCFKVETMKWVKTGGKTYDANGKTI